MADLERRVILVAGMHRSGTSALARVLNLLGAEIPGDIVPGSHGNPRGHWEPQAVVEFHDRMLQSAGSNVNSVFGVEQAWFQSEAAQHERRALAEFLQRALAETPLAVVKDPRLALFIPLWRQALDSIGVKANFIFPFRDPAEVAVSLQRRQRHFYPDAVWPLGRGVLLWLRYVLEAEKWSRGAPRAFVSFDSLLQDWKAEATRIGRQLDVKWPTPQAEAQSEIGGFLSGELKHEAHANKTADFPLAHEVLGQLARCVAEPDAGCDLFDAALARLDDAAALFRDYVSQLERTLGEHPRLRTEFVDFLNGRADRMAGVRRTQADPSPLDGLDDADEARRTALLIGARARWRIQSAKIAELELFNEALLGAARATETTWRKDMERAVSAHGEAEQRAGAAQRSLLELRALYAQVEAEQASALQETERLRIELAAASRRRETLEGELASATSTAKALEGELASATWAGQALEREMAAARSDRENLARENRELAAGLAAHKAQTDALLASSTWRLTAPVRALLKPFKPEGDAT